MLKKITLYILIGMTVVFQLMYLIKGQEDISESENRTLAMFQPFEVKAYFNGQFQDGLEDALKDQAYNRETMIELVNGVKAQNKNVVNELSNRLRKKPVEWAVASEEQHNYTLRPVGDIYGINDTDYLTRYPMLENKEYKESIIIKSNQIAEMMKRHPELAVYVYQITKSEDLNWFDVSEGIQSFDYTRYIREHLPDKVTYRKMVYDDIEDYMVNAYKTDHHWNSKGSYRGYTEVYEMLSQDYDLSELKEPTEELEFDNLKWIGSRGKQSGIIVKPDEFTAYKYDVGSHKTYIGGVEATAGKLKEYLKGDINRERKRDQYAIFYGREEQKAVLKYEFDNDGKNLLIVCDSNNKAMRLVLASHFNTTVVLDYRHIKEEDVDKLIKDNEIDIVLFLAQTKYWADTNTYLNDGKRYLFNNYPVDTEIKEGN